MVQGVERPKGSLEGREDVRKMKGWERIPRATQGVAVGTGLGQGRCLCFVLLGRAWLYTRSSSPGVVLSPPRPRWEDMARAPLLSCLGAFS